MIKDILTLVVKSVRNVISVFFFLSPTQKHTRTIQNHLLTRIKHVSTRQNVPERPIPAEQCTTGGPNCELKASL